MSHNLLITWSKKRHSAPPPPPQVDESVWELMGVRLQGLVPAALLPLLLTAVRLRASIQITPRVVKMLN